jgi:hypothetical protein
MNHRVTNIDVNKANDTEESRVALLINLINYTGYCIYHKP